jgi:hypothetical protein
MDVAPVEVTVEAHAACADATRARAALDEALASARGPRRSPVASPKAPTREGEAPRWIVVVRLERDGDLGRAEAVIRDDAGHEVARRAVTERGRTCSPLTRALGAWASLVLDQELTRAHDADATPKTTPDETPVTPYRGTGYLLPTAGPDKGGDAELPSLIVELGALAFLRSGLVGATSAAGVSPYVNVQVTPSIFLRPALGLGWSTDRVVVPGGMSKYTTAGARFDACKRIPGNYIEQRGIELDLCGGGDLMIVVTQEGSLSRLRGSIGPSANLRGQLGGGFALELRGGLGANLSRAALSSEDPAPLLVATGEVGVSTRWP